MNDLLSKLKESFPTEEIPPHGRVICIPSKLFKDQWRHELEAQGLRLVLTGHGGQSCFLVKLKEQDKQLESNHPDDKEKPVQESCVKPVTSEAKPEKTTAKGSIIIWTPQKDATLKTLRNQGLSVKQIAEKFQCSVFVISAKLRYLQNPPTKTQLKSDTKIEETAARKNHDDIEVKELLEAALLLIDSGKKAACKILLSEANMILERNNPR